MDKVGQLLTTGTVWRPRPSRMLLATRGVKGEEPLGTIVLSSARPPFHHRQAILLAKESHTELAVLASHDMDAGIVAAEMATAGVRGCVIEVPNEYILPRTASFGTHKHPSVATRKSNLSAKRNIGLLYGHLTGQKLFFLDYDIRGLSAQRLRRAGAHLDHYAIAGFMAQDHPDNSVVCHANRLTGNEQAVFISGSSLGVNTAVAQSFFPNVYNEDWLFCHEAIQARSIVLMGSVRQLPYDPFTPKRAIAEEFGDVLAEGLNYLFAIGGSLELANADFWRYFLWRRRMFIAEITRRLVTLSGADANHAARALVALRASKDILTTLTPEDLVSYIHAWRGDIARWSIMLEGLPQGIAPQEALKRIAGETGLHVRSIGP
jgi:hypothetical protein